jgi:EmrB/QacA subfamily drug resistance transporter
VTEPALASLSPPTPLTDPVATRPARHFRTIALVIASALFMEQLDATVLVTALPTMAHDLGASAPAMSSALTAYLLTLAIFIPASGWIADRFGGKRVFLAAMAMFIVGSMLCGLAPNLALLTLTRALQGLGGALMIPVSRLVLLRSVKREEMVSAMSWLLLPAMLGPILGPPVGALIMGWLSWRWIFFINVPISLVGAVLIATFIDDVQEPRPKPFDVVGFCLSGVGLGALFLALESVGHGESWIKFTPLFIVGLAGAGLYIAHARRHPHAILDLTLLKIPTFRLSLIGGSLTRITQGAQPFLLALMLQMGFGLSPLRSGLTMVATAVGALSMKALAPKILRRFGFRDSLIVGGVLASLVYALCGLFRPDWPEAALLLVLALGGLCMSFQFSGYNTIAFDGVERARTGAAMGFHTTFQQLMLSVGVCTGASALAGAMALRGHLRPAPSDFSIAFFVVTAISLSATIWNWRFDPSAGHTISGHRPEARRASA